MQNLIPKSAIQKAIEGGYDTDSVFFVAPVIAPEVEQFDGWQYIPQVIALDPTFWRAVTKEKEVKLQNGPHGNVAHYYAMRFYDLVYDGEPTEQFWADLLTSPSL